MSLPNEIEGELPKDCQPIVLERLEGHVEKVDGEVAYITFLDSSKNLLYGKYSVEKLRSQGIAEFDRFSCEVIEENGIIRTKLVKIADLSLSTEELENTRRLVNDSLSDDPNISDY